MSLVFGDGSDLPAFPHFTNICYCQHYAKRMHLCTYLNYLRTIFRFFCPRSSDTLHRWEWNLAWTCMRNITPIGAGVWVLGPQNLKLYPIFTEFRNINVPQRQILRMIFTKFAGLVGSFKISQVIKFGGFARVGLKLRGLGFPKIFCTTCRKPYVGLQDF